MLQHICCNSNIYAATYGGFLVTQKLILQFNADVLIKDTRLGGDLMMAASTTAMDCPKCEDTIDGNHSA
jgi:hypothetical protein